MQIVMVGSSGFLGTQVARALHARGHQCRVLTRKAVRRREMLLERGVTLVEADVHDDAVLNQCFVGADAVVSMAGILNPSGKGQSFGKVHVELVERIVRACRSNSIGRLLHVSALNAGKGKSRYLETKGRAEQVIRSAEDLDATIFQPSVIFGPGDSFFNRFAALLSLTPVMPLACADSKLQPVFVGDVATAMAGSMDDTSTFGRSYELGGPGVYTLAELVRFTAATMGKKRFVFGQPDFLSAMQGALMGVLPNAPFSLDNYRSLKTDNVCEQNTLAGFGISPSSIEAVVPDYLCISRRQRNIKTFRQRARHGD